MRNVGQFLLDSVGGDGRRDPPQLKQTLSWMQKDLTKQMNGNDSLTAMSAHSQISNRALLRDQ